MIEALAEKQLIEQQKIDAENKRKQLIAEAKRKAEEERKLKEQQKKQEAEKKAAATKAEAERIEREKKEKQLSEFAKRAQKIEQEARQKKKKQILDLQSTKKIGQQKIKLPKVGEKNGFKTKVSELQKQIQAKPKTVNKNLGKKAPLPGPLASKDVKAS